MWSLVITGAVSFLGGALFVAVFACTGHDWED